MSLVRPPLVLAVRLRPSLAGLAGVAVRVVELEEGDELHVGYVPVAARVDGLYHALEVFLRARLAVQLEVLKVRSEVNNFEK